MYSLYRRHESNCPHAAKGIRHTRCNCPIWMDGYDARGKRQRKSLKTRDWRRAGDILDRIERGATEPADPIDPGQSLTKASAAYIADCKARKLAAGTITSYEKYLDHLKTAFPNRALRSIDVDALSKFRESREVSATTQSKEISHLRAFLKFCLARKWIADNPALHIKPPKSDEPPTLPFTGPELSAIAAACGKIDNANQREIPRARLRAKALVLLLLYSGLRISDAIKLERTRIDAKTGKLLIRIMKTRAPLYLKLPPDVLAALAALPEESPYFFWSGRAKLSTAIGSARRTIACVLRLADVANGHPHRFRDTFSVGLLEKGVDLRTVQLLLGHTSIKTTEKHYAPFVVSMQKKLDDAVGKLHFDLSGSTPDEP